MDLALLQIALPLALIAWLGLGPLTSRLGFVVQVLSTATLLIALHLAGLWLVPPWWAPWLYWLLFGGSLALSVRSLPKRRVPSGPFGWGAAVALLALGLYSGATAAGAWSGRRPPNVPALELAFPLAGGRYFVANGGSTYAVSSHAMTLDADVPRFRRWRGQSYGVDIVGIDRFGFPARGLQPSDPARYRIWGEAIRAPCAGSVEAAADGIADMTVPHMDRTHMMGNHVILACGAYRILLAHMRRGSVRVRAGDSVRVGQPLGEVGNSRNSSAPHLHIHAQTPGTAAEPVSGDPVPIRFGGRYLVRGDRL